MMIQAIILGVVQGLTEFLPISSSGHLAVLEKIFGITEPAVLAAFLHFGTFIAIIVFFFKSIADIIKGLFKGEKESVKYVINIIIGTVPITIFGLLFKSQIEQSFNNVRFVGIMLGITGLVLLLTSITKKMNKKVTYLSALIIGIAQMFATLPGISRSGLTISAGLFSGVSPRESFKFAFLLSLPAVLGANILELRHLPKIENYTTLFVGILCSFIFGLIALRILRDLVHSKFHFFGIYCLIISLVILLLK